LWTRAAGLYLVGFLLHIQLRFSMSCHAKSGHENHAFNNMDDENVNGASLQLLPKTVHCTACGGVVLSATYILYQVYKCLISCTKPPRIAPFASRYRVPRLFRILLGWVLYSW
jgi:hypothetical protein